MMDSKELIGISIEEQIDFLSICFRVEDNVQVIIKLRLEVCKTYLTEA